MTLRNARCNDEEAHNFLFPTISHNTVDFRVTLHTTGYFYDYVYGYQKEQENLDSGHVS
jgi:hypothetical protein